MIFVNIFNDDFHNFLAICATFLLIFITISMKWLARSIRGLYKILFFSYPFSYSTFVKKKDDS